MSDADSNGRGHCLQLQLQLQLQLLLLLVRRGIALGWGEVWVLDGCKLDVGEGIVPVAVRIGGQERRFCHCGVWLCVRTVGSRHPEAYYPLSWRWQCRFPAEPQKIVSLWLVCTCQPCSRAWIWGRCAMGLHSEAGVVASDDVSFARWAPFGHGKVQSRPSVPAKHQGIRSSPSLWSFSLSL